MNAYPFLERLTDAFAKLPGIGRRTAERATVTLVQNRDGIMNDLLNALREARETVCACSNCGGITCRGEEPCRICTDSARDTGVLCVVESPWDVLLIERSGGYRGRYHVLSGKLSPMRGTGASDLRIESLLRRISEGRIKEVILALGTDVEGEATGSFLVELLKVRQVNVSRLALGLPAGSAVMYADPVTLARAINGRQPA